ncbi:putative membrane protein [Psychrobacillus sp. OK028]|uniref:PH domain-containing protein n=1 Tax=Psychrobacillus sp. OK028 TaxID=1884359 RepID=UPI00088E7FCE|nr:PH domain-containing protein [Psychrobacillus sp. OK028]SDN39013.1 putative membrane protein [Psychrobacillus sp. OK028]
MSKEKFTLHPISAVINFIKVLKEMIVPLIVVIAVNGFGGGGNEGWTSYIVYIIYAVLLIAMLVSGIIRWKRFRYWFEEEELRIEYGLFVKKKRYIPFERIQSLNYTEGILHRPFGLVKVKVETAGGGATKEADAELTAISKEAAEQIKKEMNLAKNRVSESEDQDLPLQLEEQVVQQRKPLFRMSQKDLLILASTSGGVGVFFSGLAVFVSQFSELIPYETIYNEIIMFIRFGALLIALAVFFVLLVAWIVSVAITFINYYEFTIRVEDDEIIITRGLLEKKKITIPLSRIQGVRIMENPLRQLTGYATVIVDSAGGSMAEKDEKIRLLPLIKKDQITPILVQIFPNYEFEASFTRVPKRSRKFFYRLDFLWIIPVAGAVSYFFYPFGLLSLLLLPLSFLLGAWQHKTAGYWMDEKQLVIQYRLFSRVSLWVEKKRIQAMTERTTYFQKKAAVSSIMTTIKSGVAGSTTIVPHIEKKDAESLMEWYEPTRKESINIQKEQPF